MLGRILRRLERTVNSRQAYRFFMKDWVALTDLEASAAVVKTMRFTQTLEPLEMSGPPDRRIAVVAPHPDDEMLGPGGVLIRACRAQAEVHCVYLTSEQVVEDEARAAARAVGYRTEFLRFAPYAIPVDDSAVATFARAISATDPGCIFVPFVLDDHDDHRRANQLLLLAHRQGLLPKETTIWAYQVYTTLIPNVVVDITDVADDKASTIRLWASQMEKRDWAHYMLGLNAFNCRLLGGPAPRYAETFFVLPIGEYAELCATYFTTPAAAYYTPAYRA